MTFNERLKTLLTEKGVSWKHVSKELSIGKNQPKYWEDNDTLPDGKTLIKLSQFFGVTADYLLCLSEVRSSKEDSSSDYVLPEIYRQYLNLDEIDRAKTEAYITGLLSSDKYHG
nr:MAG TPA: helix-turn-helix XRE-family like protein [Caudoviricetes sp.]